MGNLKDFKWPGGSSKPAVTVDERDERVKGAHYASEAAARDIPVKRVAKTIKEQIVDAVTVDKRKHTEDCLDANDDTSALKGKCICPERKAKVWRVRLTVSANEAVTEKAIREYVTQGAPFECVTKVSRIREVA